MTQELPEGFVAHDGGLCPVPLDSRPGVMLRCGEVTPPGGHCVARDFDWCHRWTSSFADIIAFCPEPQP